MSPTLAERDVVVLTPPTMVVNVVAALACTRK
jgi:hypothetical protein